MPAKPAWLTTAQAAERVGVTARTVRKWIAAGTLTAYRLGPRQLRIDPDDLDAMMRPTSTDTEEK